MWETHLKRARHRNPTVDALSEIITPVVYQLGLGGIGGFVVGFALKKIAKLFIIVLGIFIVALLYLGASDIISINFGALWSAVGGWLGGAGQAASWLVGLIAIIPFIGSFAVGFFLGFKLG
jgi:uncharacterized membrane protein (Fun14 family)